MRIYYIFIDVEIVRCSLFIFFYQRLNRECIMYCWSEYIMQQINIC